MSKVTLVFEVGDDSVFTDREKKQLLRLAAARDARRGDTLKYCFVLDKGENVFADAMEAMYQYQKKVEGKFGVLVLTAAVADISAERIVPVYTGVAGLVPSTYEVVQHPPADTPPNI